MKYPLLLGALLFAVPVFAMPGACSSHGGVNCNAQTQDGYAYCLDGSVSSVLYVDTVECLIRPQCVRPTPSLCTTQEDYQALQASMYRNGAYRSGSGSSLLDQCQASITTFVSQQAAYVKCIAPVAPMTVNYCPPGVYMSGSGKCMPDVTVGPGVDYNALAKAQEASTTQEAVQHAALVQIVGDLLKQVAMLQAQVQARAHASI